jgi:hypothetical protein
MEKLGVDNLFTAEKIAEMFKLETSSIFKRISILEIKPDAMIGRTKYFSKEKADCIGSFRKFFLEEKFIIFESKINFNY